MATRVFIVVDPPWPGRGGQEAAGHRGQSKRSQATRGHGHSAPEAGAAGGERRHLRGGSPPQPPHPTSQSSIHHPRLQVPQSEEEHSPGAACLVSLWLKAVGISGALT